MSVNVLLVYPRNPESFWSFRHVLRFVSKKCAFPPLGLLTVAAMLPRQWNLQVVDTNVYDLSDEQIHWADFVLLSGMIVHRQSAHEIAGRCASLGKPVVAGGPLFTTGHAEFPEIPHFVLGEAEDVIGDVVADMRAGTLQKRYQAVVWPDVGRTPVPRWDLINLRDYVSMSVQFSRGCPYECEFCDIVVMNGRVPRTKAPAQVVRELEGLRRAGWKDGVFIVDDNFIGHRRAAKDMLQALISWRKESKTTIRFLTEASVNLADHPNLYTLMVEAGFKKVFLGIETPQSESLKECGKSQNDKRDLAESVAVLQRAGLEVMGGFIVGFDSDPYDIFKRQFEFIQRSGVVTAMVGLLAALPETALYKRLAHEGRVLAETSGNNTEAALNFVTRLDREHLLAGYRELMRQLYAPRNYYRRIQTFLRSFEPNGPKPPLSWTDLKAMLKSLWLLGMRHQGRTRYWLLLGKTLTCSPRKLPVAVELAIIGYHFRQVSQVM